MFLICIVQCMCFLPASSIFQAYQTKCILGALERADFAEEREKMNLKNADLVSFGCLERHIN